MVFNLEITYAKNNCTSKFLTSKTTVDFTDVLYWSLPPLQPPCLQYSVSRSSWPLELISLCTASQNTQSEAQGRAAERKSPVIFLVV